MLRGLGMSERFSGVVLLLGIMVKWLFIAFLL